MIARSQTHLPEQQLVLHRLDLQHAQEMYKLRFRCNEAKLGNYTFFNTYYLENHLHQRLQKLEYNVRSKVRVAIVARVRAT